MEPLARLASTAAQWKQWLASASSFVLLGHDFIAPGSLPDRKTNRLQSRQQDLNHRSFGDDRRNQLIKFVLFRYNRGRC